MTDTLTEICNHKRSLVASAKANRSLGSGESWRPLRKRITGE